MFIRVIEPQRRIADDVMKAIENWIKLSENTLSKITSTTTNIKRYLYPLYLPRDNLCNKIRFDIAIKPNAMPK